MNKTIDIPLNMVLTSDNRNTQMVIELKNIRINHSFSKETVCQTSDLYIDGKRIGRCSNDGNGGNTEYSVYRKEDEPILKRCEEICKTLPQAKFDGLVFKQNLESVIDDLIDDHVDNLEKKRFENKKQKDILKGLVLSNGNDKEYLTMQWKNQTIETILKTSNGIMELRKIVTKKREEGFTILNTNLPKEVIE